MDPGSSQGSYSVKDTNITFIEISKALQPNQIQLFGIALGLDLNDILKIHRECDTNHFGQEMVIIRMIEKWKQKLTLAEDKLIPLIATALRRIDRNDIAYKISKTFARNEDLQDPEQRQKIENIQHQIEEKQREISKTLELPKIQWIEKILPLNELYIDLEMLCIEEEFEGSEGQSMTIEQMFDKVDSKDPVRILIEGGPGFGKTTLCLKLLNDWGRNKSYISSKFKMVFMFHLRDLKEGHTIEEMLISECYELTGLNNDDIIKCIKEFQNRTLLILDGFDEISEEYKKIFIPLLQKKNYPSMVVIVTSRRELFQLENKEKESAGIFKRTYNDVNKLQLWNKKILIKGVASNKLVNFTKTYLDKDFEELETKFKSIINEEMNEIFKCPLLLILLAMLFEEKEFEKLNSKTSLYKEFFNLIIRRNLIRTNMIPKNQDFDLFDKSLEHPVIQTLVQFGHVAITFLCENKLIFEEEDILKHCNDEILDLGFLIKLTTFEKHKKDNFYQPIHKSFLEFLAAFAMWNLFNTNENQFKREIERIGENGLKPTKESLFYVFLGGLMNSKAYVLFQCHIPYSLWFNLESISFTNILLEIEEINSFYPLLEPLLEKFIPSQYHISEVKAVKREFFLSPIHSLILKYAFDKQLIKFLVWDIGLPFNCPQEFSVVNFKLHFANDVCKDFEITPKSSIKCKNVICRFSASINNNWKQFVCLLNSIESETLNFTFYASKKGINSSILFLIHKELIEGEWKRKKISGLRFHLNASDDPKSLSLLVDLVKKNRINEKVWVWITASKKGTTQKELNFLKSEIEKLFHTIVSSNSIYDFYMRNDDKKISPELDFSRMKNLKWKSLCFVGSLSFLNLNKIKKEKCSVEKMIVNSFDDEKNLSLIQIFEEIKWLRCNANCFKTLIEMKWLNLEKVEELLLGSIDAKFLQIPKLFSQLPNLQVLSCEMDVSAEILFGSRNSFIELFSSLNLKICEFLWIKNLELLSYFADVLMKGLEKKLTNDSSLEEKNSTMDSNEGRKVRLQELVIGFNPGEKCDFIQLKVCDGIKWIKSMLQNKRLGKCCWIDILRNNLNLDEFLSLFPLNENFTISQEMNGSNPHSSRQSQFNYCWFTTTDRFNVQFNNN